MRATVFGAARLVFTNVKVLFSSKYLLYTNTGISVIMSCAGDGLQQKYQVVKNEITGWDKRRSRDVGITGLLFGPFCHYWYILLDRWFPGQSARVVMKKLIVDQLICSPIVITSFLFVTSYLEGRRGKELKAEIMGKGKTLYVAEWVVWPPAQIINFSFVPLRFRVLFDNTVSFGFDWYFSYIKYGVHETDIQSKYEETDKEERQWVRNVTHVPFIRVSNVDIVQLKQDTFHILSDKWRNRHTKAVPTHDLEEADNSYHDFLVILKALMKMEEDDQIFMTSNTTGDKQQNEHH